ncbi:MAG: hypothetical protein RLO80_00245 [Hyphomonas sp.]
MRFSAGLTCLSALLLAACASAPGIDRPVAVDPAYAAREAAAAKPADRCGPKFISDQLPAALVSIMGPVLDGPFYPVCARHDACYGLQEQTQAWCDDRMREEMMDICAAGRTKDSFGGRLCRIRAELFFDMVDNAFGAYAYEGEAGGQITALEIMDAPRGQFELCATVRNDTSVLQEYILDLRAASGHRVDRAPGIKERSVRAGETAVMCAGTTGSSYWSLKRLTGPVEVRLVADRPDSIAIAGDLVIVDTRLVELEAFAVD